VAEIAGRGSAGAVGLVFQTVFLPLALAPGESQLTLRGGTHVPWAPSVDYLREVFLPTVARMGLEVEMDLVAWGFYPAGGGEVRVRIRGRSGPLTPIALTDRGDVRRVWGRGVVSNLPAHIPQRMVDRARNLLARAGLKADLQPLVVRGAGPGAGIFLFVQYEHARAGFTAYGRKGLPADQVAQMACQDLLAHHETGAPVDPHLADQLLLPMALAAGTSRLFTSAVTRHLLTNIAVVQAFLPAQITVDGEEGKSGTVTVIPAS
jgi:RNA 3'-terminal phosphate cyclase (ATP)